MPYPILTLGLVMMWLLLAGFTPGQFILGSAVAVAAAHALRAMGEAPPSIRRWRPMLTLVGIVCYDIVRSNIAVARILLSGSTRDRRSGFVEVPLRLRSPFSLAALSIILTSTPGTAWLDYDAQSGKLLIHVFDLVDEEHWRYLIASRYEQLLLEIFG